MAWSAKKVRDLHHIGPSFEAMAVICAEFPLDGMKHGGDGEQKSGNDGSQLLTKIGQESALGLHHIGQIVSGRHTARKPSGTQGVALIVIQIPDRVQGDFFPRSSIKATYVYGKSPLGLEGGTQREGQSVSGMQREGYGITKNPSNTIYQWFAPLAEVLQLNGNLVVFAYKDLGTIKIAGNGNRTDGHTGSCHEILVT